MPIASPFTADDWDVVLSSGDDDLIGEFNRFHQQALYTFQPRPDNPADYDEQEGFVHSKSVVSMAIGGNASGKTEAGAYKCAKFLLFDQPPPRRDTPFWVISNTYDQSCGVCWFEKLSRYLPKDVIDWKRVQWYRVNRGWPYAVPLKPWHGRPGKNWIVEFKSYEQGRDKMQASSIGGAWFSEQFPFEIFLEVLRGCRDCMYPGGVWGEFTPIDPELSAPIEEIFDDPPEGWSFFRLNTERNRGNLSDEWYDTFFASVSDEMLETRKTGAFASYEGSIYQTFNPRIHLVDDIEIPPGAWHFRSIDWGASAEHPFVTLWLFRDGLGDYHVYDEYWNNSQHLTALDHIAEIKDRHPWPTNNARYGSTYADPSRPDLINLFAAHGIPVSPANNNVYKGIETVRSMLKLNSMTNRPRLLIHRGNCPHLAKEMRTYRWRRSNGRGINPQVAAPTPLKRNDDCVDALRYGLHSDRQRVGGEVPVAKKAPLPQRKQLQFKRHSR
jgi:hypothetical protein